MPAANPLSTLNQHPFVEAFRPEHVDRLRGLGGGVGFVRGQNTFPAGDDTHEFFLIVSGRVALEIVEPDHLLRVQTLGAGDEFGWSAVLMGRGKYFQARALEPVQALAFDGGQLLEACRSDTGFGFALMYRMLEVVSERLQATRLQLHDMFSPKAKRAGT
jgi:CRP/FNR family transcriptional regulator, cyclic AMP receptor protein